MAQSVQARITAAEYARMPETTQPMALIDGEIITMPSPKTNHQQISGQLFSLIKKSTSSGKLFYSPLDVHLDKYNVVQPDIFWVSGTDSKCQLGKDDYWHGAPDLVVEVLSESTSAFDRREKFRLYEKHGSREYWLVDPGGKYIEVWTLAKGKFSRLGLYVQKDTFKSPVLGGAKVDLKEVFES